ncbi:MAG: 4-oxalocrotonate tautomerase family protein [Puniceicoccaceae bacterium]
MPFVNIKLAQSNLTPAQKSKLIAAITDLMERELDKPPQSVSVVIEEIDPQNYGVGGKSIAQLRAERDA